MTPRQPGSHGGPPGAGEASGALKPCFIGRATLLLIFSILFILGVVTGLLISSRRARQSVGDLTLSRDSEREFLDMSKPNVATLMSDERSLQNVCYFLNAEEAHARLLRFHVFEAMVFESNVKGPTLAFWTNEPTHLWEGLPYFPVTLGTDLPGSLRRVRIEPGHVMVVRYLARLRATADGTYSLEHHTLLGYAVMTLEAARERK